MKRKLFSLFLAMVLTMSLTSGLSFASSGQNGGEGDSVQPYSTGAVGFSTKRISNTKAAASVSVQFTGYADKYTITLTLQKKNSSGSWVTATDVTGNTIKYTGTNDHSVLTYDEWTVKSGVIYRLKCVSVDEYDSGQKYTATTYSDPF